jgi:hypothetical protein
MMFSQRIRRTGSTSERKGIRLENPMTIYKQPSSPYYYYDFYSKSGDIKPPPISETLRNKIPCQPSQDCAIICGLWMGVALLEP